MIHYLLYGLALCGAGMPRAWGRGDRWTYPAEGTATCPECLAAFPLRLRELPALHALPCPGMLIHAARSIEGWGCDLAACGAKLTYLYPGDPENEAPPETEPTCSGCRRAIGLAPTFSTAVATTEPPDAS